MLQSTNDSIHVKQLTKENIPRASKILGKTFVNDPRFLYAFGNQYSAIEKEILLSEIYFPLFVSNFIEKGGAYGVFHHYELVGIKN